MTTPWSFSSAVAAMTPSDPSTFVYKIAKRTQQDAPYLSAKSLESAKRICGRREVVLLDGVVVFDPRAAA